MGVSEGNAGSGSSLQPRFCSPSLSPCSRLCPRASGCRARRFWTMCASGRRASARTSGACGIPRSRCVWGQRLGRGKAPMKKASWTYLIALPAAATGRGGAYRSAAVLTRADAGSPSVPRCRRADPGGRAPAARCRPASGAFPWFGESSLGDQMGGSLSGWVGAEGRRETYPDVLRAWRKVFSARRCCSPCGSC